MIPNAFSSKTPKLDARVDIGFTSHKQESALGLIDMRARWYDAAIGRFLSPDPLHRIRYSGQTLNRYSYVYNNPVTLRDPTGLQAAGDDESDAPSDPRYQSTVRAPLRYQSTVRDPLRFGPRDEFGALDVERTSAGTVGKYKGNGGGGINDNNKSAVAASLPSTAMAASQSGTDPRKNSPPVSRRLEESMENFSKDVLTWDLPLYLVGRTMDLFALKIDLPEVFAPGSGIRAAVSFVAGSVSLLGIASQETAKTIGTIGASINLGITTYGLLTAMELGSGWGIFLAAGSFVAGAAGMPSAEWPSSPNPQPPWMLRYHH